MNKKIGAAGALVDLLAVLGFAASMLLGLNYISYFCPIAALSLHYFRGQTEQK